MLGNYRDGLLAVFALGGIVVFGLASVVLEGLGMGSATTLTLAALAALPSSRLA